MLAGYSAAEFLGASCGRPDGPAEVLVYRYTKHDVLQRPDRIVTQIKRAVERSRCTW